MDLGLEAIAIHQPFQADPDQIQVRLTTPSAAPAFVEHVDGTTEALGHDLDLQSIIDSALHGLKSPGLDPRPEGEDLPTLTPPPRT
jgi:1-deoxy-D-xylulose 5-phosphate reductoisomerase